MHDYAQLAALAAVTRRGAFDLAAAELGVTPSAISQRIKALEDRVGALLVQRGAPCTATPTGLRLIRHFDTVALLEQALGDALPARAPVVRVAVNADSLATWFLPALARLPDLRFDIVIDDQDHSQDLLKRGEVVAAVTGHPGPLQGCDTRALGALRYRATCAPAFRARWLPGGATARALAQAPALAFSDKDRLQRDWLRREFGVGIATPAHHIASSHGFVDAALLGLGWGMNPDALTAAHLASGALEEVLPDRPLDVALFWQFNRLAAGALAPLTRAVRDAARAVLLAP